LPEGVYGARSVASLPLPLSLVTSGSEGVGVIRAQMTGDGFDEVLEVSVGSRHLAGLSKTPPDPKKHVVRIAIKESLFGALVQRRGAGS
jgi:hypothetical protein